MIHSDEWATYRTLQAYGFRLQTVNHKRNFVNPEKGAHKSGWENEVAIRGRIDADVFYSKNYITHRQDLEASTFIWSNFVIFIAKHPAYTTKWTTIIYSLQPTTWTVFAVVAILLTITESLKLHCPTTSASITQNPSCAVTMVCSLVGQSIVRKIPGRVRKLLSVWLLSSMFVTMYFSSNLPPLLTISSAELRSSRGHGHNSDHKIYIMTMLCGPIEDYFNKTTNPEMASIWKRATLPPLMNCMMKSITMVDTARIGFDTFLDPLLQANATLTQQLCVQGASLHWSFLRLNKCFRATQPFFT